MKILKNTGVMRKVDELGRLVIPRELCHSMGIGPKDEMDIRRDGDDVVVTVGRPDMGIGIRRPLDSLDRLVIPKELRVALDITADTPLEIYISGGSEIILRKHQSECVFCGENDVRELLRYGGKAVCRACAAKVSGMVEALEADKVVASAS